MSDTNYAQLLGSEGPLAAQISGFTPRLSQQAMAQAVARALAKQQILIAEAGTGTGKTFAYLLPALLSQKKIIISTGTKNLQDQLFHRDLPLLRKSLAVPFQAALLKGRNNYLCHQRLEINRPDEGEFSKKIMADYAVVLQWSSGSMDGDITAIKGIAEDSAIWPLVTSTVENCLGQECPHLEKCFILKARRRSQQADVLVINHHLFFANFSLQQDGFGELLPESDAIIFDEAHQLPEIASQFLGTNFSSRQFNYLIRDIKVEALKTARDMQDIFHGCDKLEMTINDMRLAFGVELVKNAWQMISRNKNFISAVQSVTDALKNLQQVVHISAERSQELTNLYQRTLQLNADFQQVIVDLTPDHIHWYETFKKSFSIHLTPLSIAPHFKKYLTKKQQTFIFTSATLAVNNHFEHFAQTLGIETYNEQHLLSPFDFKQQALLYLPRNLPNPNAATYTENLLQAALPLIEANKGRTFFLFTSYRALEFAAQWLAKKINFPLLIQGEAAKSVLINNFCNLGNAVLLGTSSFWEGVDVRGQALSLVIIDKLPFASPSDPVLQARSQALKKRGKQPFYDYQLPAAVIDLKQGAGRLIRDISDRGVLMIGDPRLTGRDYGELFFKALPAMARTRNSQRVIDFINEGMHEIVSN